MTNQRTKPPIHVPPSLVEIRKRKSEARLSTAAGETPKVPPSLAAIASRRSARVSNDAAKPANKPQPATRMGAVLQAAAHRNMATAARRDPRARGRLRTAVLQAAGKLTPPQNSAEKTKRGHHLRVGSGLTRPPLLLSAALEAAIRRRVAQT